MIIKILLIWKQFCEQLTFTYFVLIICLYILQLHHIVEAFNIRTLREFIQKLIKFRLRKWILLFHRSCEIVAIRNRN